MKSLSVEHQHGNGHSWDRVTNEKCPAGESELAGATDSGFIPNCRQLVSTLQDFKFYFRIISIFFKILVNV